MTEMKAGPHQGVAETFEGFRVGSLTGTTETLQLVAEGFRAFQVLVQADPDNGANVRLGDYGTQHIILTAGSSITIPVGKASLIYVDFLGTDDTVHWMAMV